MPTQGCCACEEGRQNTNEDKLYDTSFHRPEHRGWIKPHDKHSEYVTNHWQLKYKEINTINKL
jgi:hypothetical protein